MRTGQRRQPVGEFPVDGVDRIAGPRAPAHVEERRARRIAKLHEVISGEEKIQVIVRQEHVPEPGIVRRLVAFQPEYLGRSKPGKDEVAGLADRGLRSAEFLGEDRALRRRAGIAPEFRGADHIAVEIERHEAVLLPRHADAAHPLAVDLGGHFAEHEVQGRRPLVRVLLHVPDRQTLDQFVRGPRLRDDMAGREVEDDRFDALGAGINADVEGHEGRKTGCGAVGNGNPRHEAAGADGKSRGGPT